MLCIYIKQLDLMTMSSVITSIRSGPPHFSMQPLSSTDLGNLAAGSVFKVVLRKADAQPFKD